MDLIPSKYPILDPSDPEILCIVEIVLTSCVCAHKYVRQYFPRSPYHPFSENI